jgi:integrase
LEPGKEWFTKPGVATVIGVKPAAVTALVRRHGLAADGNGKARRFPRSTVEAICRLRAAPTSARTANYYLGAIGQFCRWLVRNQRLAVSPVAHLNGLNAAADRRHRRRPLTPDELRRLVRSAQCSTYTFRGLSGTDRATLYVTAAATGFRAGELARLTPQAFELTARPPTATLAAEHAKNGRTAVQPLPTDVAATLRNYLSGRQTDQPVWPGAWWQRAADMIRADLSLARVPFAVDGPEGRLCADFHCLRHTMIAFLDKSGATLKEAMQLARHSDPKLTMAVYGRAHLSDLGAVVDRLSKLIESEPAAEQKPVPTCTPACTELVQDGDTGCDVEMADAGVVVGEFACALRDKPLGTGALDGGNGLLMGVGRSAPLRTRT